MQGIRGLPKELRLNPQIREIEGISGLKHIAEVVDVLGEKMMYLEVNNYTTDIDIYKAFLTALDTGLGLYLKCYSRPPAWILDSADRFHVIVELVGGEED